jgi:hypothetical protein
MSCRLVGLLSWAFTTKVQKQHQSDPLTCESVVAAVAMLWSQSQSRKSRVKESRWLHELRADGALEAKDKHAVRVHFEQCSGYVRLVG